jgi:hypothetical protein
LSDPHGVTHLRAGDELLAVGDADGLFSELPKRCRAHRRAGKKRVVGLIDSGVQLDIEVVDKCVADSTADRVQAVERPEVEQVDIVAAVHPGPRPHA